LSPLVAFTVASKYAASAHRTWKILPAKKCSGDINVKLYADFKTVEKVVKIPTQNKLKPKNLSNTIDVEKLHISFTFCTTIFAQPFLGDFFATIQVNRIPKHKSGAEDTKAW
jgi:hypothetical protein